MAHMRSTAISLLAGVAILGLVPAALAHGGDEAVDMGHAGGDMPKPSEDSYPTTYFSHSEHQGMLYTHIALMGLSWIFILPVAVMFSIARSRYTIISQILFGATNAAGLFFAMVYNANTPDLYPNNAHHKLGWIVTWVFAAQFSIGILARLAGALSKGNNSASKRISSRESQAFIPVSTQAMADHNNHGSATRGPYRLSNDSGHGTERNTESLRSHSSSSSTAHDEEAAIPRRDAALKEYHVDGDDNYDEEEGDYLAGATRGGGVGSSGFPASASSLARRISNSSVHRLAKKAAGLVPNRAWRVLVFGYNFIDRVILILGFIAFCTGIIAQGRFFEGNEIFSGLAHWIKGGVFFWLGIFTLGRWTGAFGEIGWAWNIRPRSSGPEKWRPTAEFMESFLIFFYGSTNIFLEHLGGWGQAWTPQDLEHISITVLFIGGGLCGMLIESKVVRELLNTTVSNAAAAEYPYAQDSHHGFHHVAEGRISSEEVERRRQLLEPPRAYGFSLNPIPALVILLLGITMSSHTQHNMVSSMVHKQWGNLLMGAAFARGFSYVLMWLKPPRSVLPSRPPTELLASFGLMAGGIIFMASSADTITGMIHMDMDAMFMYTVTMGLVATLMAWVIVVMAIKGWAVRREAKR